MTPFIAFVTARTEREWGGGREEVGGEGLSQGRREKRDEKEKV